jgi:small subunit ribosomal protein S6e
MEIKLDIGTKEGKTYHYELKEKSKNLLGKKIGDIVKGEEIDKKFAGYEFEITGLSNISGFPGIKGVKAKVKRLLLSYGVGMRQRRPKGLRRKKSVHGEEITDDVVQVNMKVVKEGPLKLSEIIGKKE